MDYVSLTEQLICSIVKDKDIVKVKQFEQDDDKVTQIEAFVSSEDLPRVIGKNGKTINSIRTLVQVSSNLNDNKIIKINVQSI